MQKDQKERAAKFKDLTNRLRFVRKVKRNFKHGPFHCGLMEEASVLDLNSK